MSVDSRVVYGRSFRVTPVWLWLLQRLSGVALGPLVVAHIFVPDVGQHPVLKSILLMIVVAHGYSGIRRLIVRLPQASPAMVTAVVWTLLVLAFGLIAILYRQ